MRYHYRTQALLTALLLLPKSLTIKNFKSKPEPRRSNNPWYLDALYSQTNTSFPSFRKSRNLITHPSNLSPSHYALHLSTHRLTAIAHYFYAVTPTSYSTLLFRLFSFFIAHPLIATTRIIQAIRNVIRPIETVKTNIASRPFNSIDLTVSLLWKGC